MTRNKITALVLAVACFALVPSAQAGIFDFLKKKKPAKTEKAPEKTPYERILTSGKIVSAKGDFLTLHKTDEKLYIELPVKTIGDEVLISATLSSISNPQLGMVGYKNSSPVHMRFAQRDSAIVLEAVNSNPYLFSDKKSEEIKERLSPSYKHLPLYKFPIKAWNKDKTTVLIDATSLFTEDQKYFRLISRSAAGMSVTANQQRDLSVIRELKSFEDNVSVKVDRSYRITLSSQRGTALQDYPVTIGATFTILRLPKEQMVPRISDTRVGLFLTPKIVLNPETNEIEQTNFVKRWRIEPSDVEAFKRGELVTPKKPIIFYVESTFPPLWKEAMKEGTLRWNAAFERIGFKDAIQVRDFPTDDPNFDPDNLKYNCIRYVPIPTENAMGPSWADPRTGEIINATVLVWSDVSKLNNNWRFIQTAQNDPAVRAMKLPDSLMSKSLKYVIAHEIGHTLGFMHNMGSSAAYSVDSLRSATFTATHGTTPSIMDYARFNYVVQPEDKGVTLDPPTVGTYDKYAIEWTYKYFPDTNGDAIEEFKRLSAFVEKHAHDPEYRYGMPQDGSRAYDPSAIEEDLSGDPVAASTLGLKNLKYIISHLGEWFAKDEEADHRTKLYEGIAGQAMRYVHNVFLNVPGIYLNQTSEESGLPRYRVVPKAKQRESALWLLDQAVSIDSLRNEKLEQSMGDVAVDSPFVRLGAYTRAQAIRNIISLNLTYYLDSTSYSPAEYATDVYARVFAKTEAGKEDLTPAERQLQEFYVRYLTSYTEDLLPKSGGGSKLSSGGQIGSVGQDATFRPEGMTDDEFIATLPQSHQDHFCSLRHEAEEEQVKLYQQGTGILGFGKSYGEPEDLFTGSIGNATTLFLPLQYQAEALLKKVIPMTRSKDLKLHYQTLLRRLEVITK